MLTAQLSVIMMQNGTYQGAKNSTKTLGYLRRILGRRKINIANVNSPKMHSYNEFHEKPQSLIFEFDNRNEV